MPLAVWLDLAGDGGDHTVAGHVAGVLSVFVHVPGNVLGLGFCGAGLDGWDSPILPFLVQVGEPGHAGGRSDLEPHGSSHVLLVVPVDEGGPASHWVNAEDHNSVLN